MKFKSKPAGVPEGQVDTLIGPPFTDGPVFGFFMPFAMRLLDQEEKFLL